MFSFHSKYPFTFLKGNRICIVFFNQVRAYFYICFEANASDYRVTGLIFNGYHEKEDGVL